MLAVDFWLSWSVSVLGELFEEICSGGSPATGEMVGCEAAADIELLLCPTLGEGKGSEPIDCALCLLKSLRGRERWIQGRE